jgi:hypothetical protein
MNTPLSQLFGRAARALGLVALSLASLAHAGTQCGFGSKPDLYVGYTALTMNSSSSGSSGTWCTDWSPNSGPITSLTQRFSLTSYTSSTDPQSGVKRIYSSSAKKVSQLPYSGKIISAKVTKTGNIRRGVDMFLYNSSGTWKYDIIVNYGTQSFTATHGTNKTVPGLPGKWKVKIDTNPYGTTRIAYAPWPDGTNLTSLSVDYCQLLKWMLNTTKWISDSDSYVRRIGVSGEVVGESGNSGTATWTNIRIDGY